MEAQTFYAKETKLNDNLFKTLFLVQIKLEKFKQDQTHCTEQVEKIIQSIDEFFQYHIENGWEPDS